METISVDRANRIVDQISEIAQNGGFLSPVALSRVGAASTAQALAALYLVTAETFRKATFAKDNEYQKILEDFVRAAGGTGMWIATQFSVEGQDDGSAGIDPSVSEAETIDSFVAFLRSLDLPSTDYWDQVYSRIGIPNPDSA